MSENKNYLPTDSELEVLQIIWKNGPVTVREVHEALGPARDIGYTTTLKTMQIMSDKGILERDTSARKHVYSAKISRENTEQNFLAKMINGLFSGSASRMVLGALDNKKLSESEIMEIKEYLNQF